LVEGGTGGQSTLERQPENLPDRYESGTPNIPGLVALGEAVSYISRRGVEDIRAHESHLLQVLIEGLSGIKGAVLFGPCDPSRQIGVLSFHLEGMDPAEVGSFLEGSRDIVVRVGLHCSPHSHSSY
jgi:selenocysteine lyase/cysteine desulfurase